MSATSTPDTGRRSNPWFTGSPIRPVRPALTARRHVDLARVSSAICLV